MKIKLNLKKAQDSLIQKESRRYGTILLVDDEQENLDGLSALLSKEYTVYATTTPRHAIELVREHHIDLVISDQRMPDMLGTELLQYLRDLNPYQVRVLLTGYADLEDLIGCVNQGLLYRYLVKPWIPGDLVNTVRQAFDKIQIEKKVRLQAEALEIEVAERRQAQENLENTLRELKETQDALLLQERLRALGEMVAGVAHDFNNLLTPIYAYCEDLIDSASSHDADTLESLHCIRNAVVDGQALIERLRVSHFPKTTNVLTPIILISMREFLRDSIALAVPRWSLHKNEELCIVPSSRELDLNHSSSSQTTTDWCIESNSLKISCSVDNGGFFYGDKSDLRQAVVNLICNALDAMKSKAHSSKAHSSKAHLQVSSFISEEMVSIKISDNGIGMSAETLKKCRIQFFSTKGDQGSGLGLHMVHSTAENHNGSIELESQLGIGTTAVSYGPEPITTLLPDQGKLTKIACGWAHSCAVVPISNLPTGIEKGAYEDLGGPPLSSFFIRIFQTAQGSVVAGDIDGFVGQLLNGLLQFMTMFNLCKLQVSFCFFVRPSVRPIFVSCLYPNKGYVYPMQ